LWSLHITCYHLQDVAATYTDLCHRRPMRRQHTWISVWESQVTGICWCPPAYVDCLWWRSRILWWNVVVLDIMAVVVSSRTLMLLVTSVWERGTLERNGRGCSVLSGWFSIESPDETARR
jgi:hypothetical protein